MILIPARSGSSRVKNKNVRKLGEAPLLVHVIKAAIASKMGRVVVSTNSENIAQIAIENGAEVPFLRPDNLSTKMSPSLYPILHALGWFEENESWNPEYVIFTPPTNPFLRPITIVNMVSKIKSQNFNSIVTVTRAKTHPLRIVNIFKDRSLQNDAIKYKGITINQVERSQDFPVAYEGSPACRITKSDFFMKILEKHKNIIDVNLGKTYDINSSLSYEISQIESFDIDIEFDFLLASIILELKFKDIEFESNYYQ